MSRLVRPRTCSSASLEDPADRGTYDPEPDDEPPRLDDETGPKPIPIAQDWYLSRLVIRASRPAFIADVADAR